VIEKSKDSLPKSRATNVVVVGFIFIKIFSNFYFKFNCFFF